MAYLQLGWIQTLGGSRSWLVARSRGGAHPDITSFLEKHHCEDGPKHRESRDKWPALQAQAEQNVW